MTDVAISSDTNASPLQGADIIPIVRPGNPAGTKNMSILGTELAEYIRDTIGTALVQGAGMTITVNDAGDTITLAAAPRHPGYRSNARYRFGNFGTAAVAQNANNLCFVPMIVESTVTLTGADLSVTVVDGTNTGVLVGIYNNNSTTFKPGTRIANATATLNASVLSATTTRYVAFASPVTLTPGLYWRAIMCQGAPTCISIAASDNLSAALLGTDSATAPHTAYNCWLATSYGYANGLPADASSSPTLVLSAGQPGLAWFVAQ